MTALAHGGPQLVEISKLEEYPIAKDANMNGHRFVMFNHDRWLNSDTYLKMQPEVGWFFLNLIMLSQKQRPVGTLPDDDELLAKLLHLDLARWKDLKNRAMSPLRGWYPVNCEGERRLAHRVVTEFALEAVDGRIRHQQSNEEKAVYARRKRIREALAEFGCDKSVLADDVLIQRLDEWLTANCVGNRKKRDYERAVMHAAGQQWFDGGLSHRRK